MDQRAVVAAAAFTGGAAAGWILKGIYSGWDRRAFLYDNLLTIPLAVTSDLSSVPAAKVREEADRLLSLLSKIVLWRTSRLGFSDQHIQVPVGGDVTIPVRVWKPVRHSGGIPMLIWIHGGGMVVLSEDDPMLTGPVMGFGIAQRLAGRAVIASIGYRRSPEVRAPVGVEDCINATQWLMSNAERFGASPNRVSIGGYSAGGFCAAVVHQEARKQGWKLQSAFMVAPMMRRGAQTMSMIENGHIPTLPTKMMVWYWNHFMPDPTAAEDPRCNPLKGIGEGGLAPATVVTCELDVLRDEGIEYYEALKKVGVKVEHVSVRGSHVLGVASDSIGRELMLQKLEQGMGLVSHSGAKL